MNAKQFNGRVSSAEGVASFIFLLGWIATFAISLSALAGHPSDRLVGVVLLMVVSIIGYITWKNWATISKKSYRLKFALPETHEAIMSHWDSMFFLAKMMNLYHKGKLETFTVEVSRLTEDEEKKIEEEDQDE